MIPVSEFAIWRDEFLGSSISTFPSFVVFRETSDQTFTHSCSIGAHFIFFLFKTNAAVSVAPDVKTI